MKPRFNESINHLFVTYDIAEYLENQGIKVQMFVTKKPDIVFKLNNKKIAIEVETGKNINKKQRLLEKKEVLNKDYDYWFFVVTDKNCVKFYRGIADTIDSRYLSFDGKGRGG